MNIEALTSSPIHTPIKLSRFKDISFNNICKDIMSYKSNGVKRVKLKNAEFKRDIGTMLIKLDELRATNITILGMIFSAIHNRQEHPLVQDFVKVLNISKRAVLMSLEKLENEGFLIRDKKKYASDKGFGFNPRNHYRIHPLFFAKNLRLHLEQYFSALRVTLGDFPSYIIKRLPIASLLTFSMSLGINFTLYLDFIGKLIRKKRELVAKVKIPLASYLYFTEKSSEQSDRWKQFWWTATNNAIL